MSIYFHPLRHIALDKLQQYTNDANKLNAQIKHKHSTAKGYHMTKTIYKIMSKCVITFIYPLPDTYSHYNAVCIYFPTV